MPWPASGADGGHWQTQPSRSASGRNFSRAYPVRVSLAAGRDGLLEGLGRLADLVHGWDVGDPSADAVPGGDTLVAVAPA